MKKIFYLFVVGIAVFSSLELSAQGCVAVRNFVSGTSQFVNAPKSWQFNMNYRYFKSYKHFVGRDEQEHRVENGTEVINHDNSILLGANYTLNNRWNFSAIVPVVYIDRSSLYEHYGNTPGN